jgi:hypothetical protein
MLLGRLLAVSLLLISSPAFAGLFNINLSNTSAQVEGGFSADGSSETKGSYYFNDQGSKLVDASLLVKGGGGDDSASGPSGGGGAKFIVGEITQQGGQSNFVSAVALGGQVSAPLPSSTPIALVGEFFSSLRVTTYGDANHFSQFALRVEMGPPQAKLFVGYREITFSITGGGDVAVDKGSYMGVLFKF